MPSPPVSPHDPSAPPVALRGITVSFGPVQALRDVDLELAPGERHAVVGENGAGKSTLMKVLFGLIRPDSGQVVVANQPRRFASPADAIALGIGMVQQHFELIPSFTVTENIVLGAEVTGGYGLLDTAAATNAIQRLADESGLCIDPRARVEDLSVAAQQRVEILKALYRQARVLILDEPTAVLAPSEARDLWAATERLARSGTTIAFITHKLDEVMANADTVTVLRRGRRILTTPAVSTDPAALAAAMIGSGQASDWTATEPTVTQTMGQKPLLSVAGLSVRGRRGETVVDDVTLDLLPGEILGIAGVDGSGQTELIEALFGLRATASGTIFLDGTDITRLSLARRRAAGVACVPEDRHHRALILPFSCEANAVLGRHREPAFRGAGGLLKRQAMRDFLQERAASFDVRGAAVGLPVRSLSGGNQQKLVLARELSRGPRVLLASQPTRGLDFAASTFVHEALRAERDRGVGVLLQSLDIDEVLSLSDRVAVMFRGKIAGILPRADATETRVGALMTGAASA